VNLSADHIRVLGALRAAAVLRREPKTLTPDGHEHWWALAELRDDGRFDSAVTDAALARLSSVARGLRKSGLVAGRTTFTVTRYAITGEGLLALASWEAEHGLSEVAAAERDIDQAHEDERQARVRARAAEGRLAAALEELNEAKRSRQS